MSEINNTVPSVGGPQCSHGACVDVKTGATALDPTGAAVPGVLLTSTIDGNDGSVTYTNAEWARFVADVKAGKWDHTVEND